MNGSPFTDEIPLVEAPKRYPYKPGWKSGETSKAAAEAMAQIAGTLRERVLAEFKLRPSTADEVAARLGITPLAARPRVTELSQLNLIEKTGERRRNASGQTAFVWRTCTPDVEP